MDSPLPEVVPHTQETSFNSFHTTKHSKELNNQNVASTGSHDVNEVTNLDIHVGRS